MNQIIRHSAPSKLDHAPFGTECIVPLLGDEYDLYVQYSSEEDNPRWELMGRYHDKSYQRDELKNP